MTKIKETFNRNTLSIVLVFMYPIVQTLASLSFIDFPKAFIHNMSLWSWLGLVALLGVETFKNAIGILTEFRNPTPIKQKDENPT